MHFRGKVAIVTGGAAGIGEAVATRIARDGGCVAIADVRLEAANETAARLRETGLDVLAVEVDVSQSASAEALVGRVLERWGHVDILVNNAGIESSQPMLEISHEAYRRVMAVNTDGVWNCCQAVLPSMLHNGGGAIVNIASVAAQKGGGFFGTAAYAASKGAVISLSKAIAREFARQGIRCNAVCPSLTLTPMGRRVVEEKGGLDRVMGMTPLGRPAEPSEIAAVVAFLASDDASYVTGHVYNADGGAGM